MAAIALTFVLSDRGADLDATFAAAGFDGAGARRFRALYGGLSRSERRVARAAGTRLWLPVSLEPMLTGSSFGLDDEPPPEPLPGELGARGGPAGTAALELGWLHRGGRVAIVLKARFVDAIIAELDALLPGRVLRREPGDAVREIELDLGADARAVAAIDRAC